MPARSTASVRSAMVLIWNLLPPPLFSGLFLPTRSALANFPEEPDQEDQQRRRRDIPRKPQRSLLVTMLLPEFRFRYGMAAVVLIDQIIRSIRRQPGARGKSRSVGQS